MKVTQGFVRSATAVVVAVLMAAAAAAPLHAAGPVLFYEEVEKDGRIYVFNTPERLQIWKESGEMGAAVTLVGRGANGETIVAENEVAIDMYLFKHNLPGYDRPTAPPPPPPPTYPQVKVGGLAYLSYQNGTTKGVDYSKVTIKRGYILVNATINSFFGARLTPDVTQDDTGDIKLRIKYAYGQFKWAKSGFLTKPNVEFGVAHMPWLDFEEHVNMFRMQDTMFMERNGLFNSADVGVTFAALLGPELDDTYKKAVSSYYPGKYGSFSFGVYNGSGYHAKEKNENKVVEGRVTVRPIPNQLPGLQVSYFGIAGKGNTEKEPDWLVNTLMGSYQHKYLVLTGTWYDGKGNQSGSAVDADGKALERDGWSFFTQLRPTPDWSVIVRYDFFDPNKDVEDDGNKRTIVGVAYEFAHHNYLLFDYDRVDYEKSGVDADDRLQLTLQVSF
ncbi:MAG: hypothetical protein AB1714_17020 [Acidobacteriota bacterium]